jgi:hypothetical protein
VPVTLLPFLVYSPFRLPVICTHHLHFHHLLTPPSHRIIFFVQITVLSLRFAPRVDSYPTLSADNDIYSSSACRRHNSITSQLSLFSFFFFLFLLYGEYLVNP